MFRRYIGVFALFVVIHSTSEVGGMLITLRCVDKKDKAMALGLLSVAVGLFGKSFCELRIDISSCAVAKKQNDNSNYKDNALGLMSVVMGGLGKYLNCLHR